MSCEELEESIACDDIDVPVIAITENGIEGFEVLCRLCANRSGHLVPIYSQEGVSNDLAAKMNEYLPVRVCATDSLPLQCCYQCASTVLGWHELVVASREADRRLRELHAEAERHLQQQNYHFQQHPEELGEQNDIKMDSDDDREKLIENMKKSPENKNNRIKSDKSTGNLNLEETNQKKHFKCKICSKTFAQKRYLDNHIRIHNINREFTCEKCAKNFVGRSGLTRHINDVHLGIKNFSCSVCSLTFASGATRNDHMRRKHTSEKPFSCSTCNKTFSTKASLFQHKKIHQSTFPFVCVICDKKFKRKHELTYHATIHSEEKSHCCPTCGKCFRIAAALTRHFNVHSNLKTYKCTICEQVYKNSRSLSHHMKIKHKNCIEKCEISSTQ